MKLRTGLALIVAMGLTGSVTAQTLAQDCPALMDPDAFPDRLSFLAPLNADPDSTWILRGSDERTDFGFSDEGLALLEEIVTALKNRYGTTLVTVVPPPRGLFAPHAAERDAIASRYQTLLEDLRKTGAIVPDIMTEVAATENGFETFYFRTDTHWAPAGTMMAARATATALAEAGRYGPAELDSTYVIGSTAEQMEHTGTIVRAVKDICNVDLPPEVVAVHPVLPVAAEDTATALFGDTDLEHRFVLIGTSFTNLSETDRLRWGDSLRYTLQSDVINRGVGGGSFAGAFNAYAETDLATERPEFLIWEFLHAYVWQSTSVQLRDMLATVIAPCPADAPQTLVPISDEEWVRLDSLPEGHDIVQLTLPGIDLGTVFFAVDHESGTQSRGRILRNERVGSDERTDTWLFYAGEFSEEGLIATGGALRVQVRGMDLPIVGSLRTCSAEDAGR